MKPPPPRPLWRLEDLLALCFQPEELHRSLSRMFPHLVSELPPVRESAAQFAHESVGLLERHGSIGAPLFAHLLTARPLRRAQILSAAFALSVDKDAIESLIADGGVTHVFLSPITVKPKIVDALEGLVLELERASPDDPRRAALSEDIEHLAAHIRTRRPVRCGDRVAGTILEYLIGRGSFGTVWRSRDAETGAPRATKIFDVNRLTDGIMLWRFRRGIRALQMLNKYRGAPPSIAKVFTVAEDGLAFAMEYLPRGSLDKVAQRNWTMSHRIAIFCEICRAVSFAHRAGVIHRDIKPTNVMFDANLRPVLIDFDIADVQFLTEQKLTSGGLGTPMFAAPEQLECAGEVDERADVYSLGRLLHYMLIERVPTYSEREEVLDNLHRFPPSLSHTVGKATKQRPEDRFNDVDLLRRAVETYKTGLVALRANLRRTMHWARRNAVALLVASSVTTGALLYGKHQELLASTHREYQVKAETLLLQYEALGDALVSVQSDLEEARRDHAELEQQLDDARAKLVKLESGEVEIKPVERQKYRRDLRAQVEVLEIQLHTAEVRLDRVHDELRTTLDQMNRVRGLRATEPEARAAVLKSDPVEKARSEALKGVQPDAPTKSAPKGGGVRSRAVVDLQGRKKEIWAKALRLKPSVRTCRKRDGANGSTAGFMMTIDAKGKTINVSHNFGDMSERSRACIKKILKRIRWSPMKPGSTVNGHIITFAPR